MAGGAAGTAGLIVGGRSERPALRRGAQTLALLSDGVPFLRRNDVREPLGGTEMLVVSPDHEGCPNVVL